MRRDGEPWISAVRPHRRRWRFLVGCGSATTEARSFDSREEAEQERKKALKGFEKERAERTNLTLEEALERFEKYKEEDRGGKLLSAERDRRRVASFFGRSE